MKSCRKFVRVLVCCALVVTSTLAAASYSAAQGFTENFVTDVADWGDANSTFNPLTFVASGGPDGSSYATTAAPLSALGGGAGGSSAVLFRAQDADQLGESNGFLTSASGGAFEGNYITRGIGQVRAFVRHDAPEALTFFYRGSTAFNFPAIAANNNDLVQPNEWTEILFDLNPANPDLALESFPMGPNFFAIMSGIGHLQIGVNIPESQSMNSTPINFDIDQVSIRVPEPTALAMVVMACVVRVTRRRRSV